MGPYLMYITPKMYSQKTSYYHFLQCILIYPNTMPIEILTWYSLLSINIIKTEHIESLVTHVAGFSLQKHLKVATIKRLYSEWCKNVKIFLTN